MSSNNQSTQADLAARVKEVTEMGFPEKRAVEALNKFNNDVAQAINFLISNPEELDPELERAMAESLKEQPIDELMIQQDIEMNKAIENSIKQAGPDHYYYEPLNPESNKRKSGMPVGLKNIGNTCYFNSLTQFYFLIPKLVQEVLQFNSHPSHKIEPAQIDDRQKLEYLRKKASILLVEELQKLFSYMISSRRKYIDPSKVLNALVDDFGNQIRVGDQKDVGEFHLILVARIEEGLRTKHELEPEAPVMVPEYKEASPPRRKESLNFVGHNISENTIVSQLFYAKQIEHLKTQSEVLRNEVVFGQIILDVEEKDLYSAWDASYHSEINDYFIDNSFKSAYQEIWPITFPGVLLFQIQRVKFDIASQNSVKINKKFSFPQELVTDRFLLANKDESTQLRSKMLELKSIAREIEKNLELINNYHDSEISVEKVLENTLTFLRSLRESKSIEENIAKSPEDFVIEGRDLVSVVKVLEEIRGRVSGKVAELQENLKRVHGDIEDLYSSENLRKNKYRLHSILIHEGYAGSGHYYAFTHDFEGEKWRKYSDLLITEVTFEDVMKDSIGGNGLASAYCLLYVKENLLEKSTLPHWSFDLENLTNTVYFNSIPPFIRSEIEEDNRKFEEEIEIFNASQTFDKVRMLYESRLDQILAFYKNNNNHTETIRLALINFFFHLKIVNTSDIYKKLLLSICFKEVTGNELSQLEFNDRLNIRMNNYYQALTAISKSDRELIEKEKNEYIGAYFNAEIANLLARMLIEGKYLDAFKLIVFHNDMFEGLKNDYYRMVKDCTKALALRLTSQVFVEIYNAKYEEMMLWYSVVGHLICHVIDETDYVKRAATKRLECAKDEFKTSYKGEYLKYEVRITEALKEIENGSAIAAVDFGETLDEVEMIRAAKEVFDPTAWAFYTQEDSVACRTVKIRKMIEENAIQEWFILAEKTSKTRSYSEKMFKETEKKAMIINRN